MITLYHGSSSIENLKSIVKNGFDLNKIGTGWGNTYGNGIYFTDNLKVAHEVYSNKNGYIIEIIVEDKTYKLTKDYSVTNRSHKKEIKKIVSTYIDTKKYNMLVTNSVEPEYILFDLSVIKSINLVQI